MTRGIKMQPGRVTSVAIVKGKPVIMLPGHILSMVIGALFVLLPIIDGVNHLSPQHCPRIKATSSERVDVDEWKTFKRVRFVKLTTRKNGYIAEPVMGDSSMLSVLVKSNGLIVIPEGVDTVEKGEQVEVYLLPF
jgi:molybdopterin biosynthesis enzyme